MYLKYLSLHSLRDLMLSVWEVELPPRQRRFLHGQQGKLGVGQQVAVAGKGHRFS